MSRSPFLHGLGLTLRQYRPLLWAYAFNAGVAWFATSGLRIQYGNVVNNSLAAQRMIGGFDLGVAFDAARRLSDGPQGSLTPSFLGIPVYLLFFFLLVPGTLLTYQSNTRMPLGSLLLHGLQSFWSFFRILLLTLLVAGPILVLLNVAQTGWRSYIDQTLTGRPAFLLRLAGLLVIFLVASALRLYFDLVEIHTVSLAQTVRGNGKPDRRIRRTLRPALRTVRIRFLRNYFGFICLALLGFTALSLLTLSALHHLAQPRFWPTLLLAQTGLFLLLFTRFWQRAAETIHFTATNPTLARSSIFALPRAGANPPPPPPLEPAMTHHASSFPTPNPGNPISPILPGPDSNPFPAPAPSPIPGPWPDPLPNPEPISPSLAAPDTAIFFTDTPPKKNLLD